MDRRESLKSLLVGSVAGGLILNGCSPQTQDIPAIQPGKTTGYGRTPEERERDEKLLKEQFFSVHELETIAVLCDLILPASGTAGSARAAGVPEFIEFIAKDIPAHKLPLRGGIMWLDSRANKQFEHRFISCSDEQQRRLLDEIAYPDKAEPESAPGVAFFTLLRDLTLTGYYTSKMGLEDLGYKGNTPNVWDGVPKEVLREHDVYYEEEWLSKCIDQKKRNEIARWDDKGNLVDGHDS